MSCVICGGITRPYLSVDFSHFGTSLKRGFYERCKECGFTYNVAAYDMDAAAWGELVCLIHSRWVERERDFVDERKVMGGNYKATVQNSTSNTNLEQLKTSIN